MPRTVKLCPCGSGKPFETCCRNRKVVHCLEQARWRRASQTLRRNLGLYADRPSFAWDAAQAQDLYLGCQDQQMGDGEDNFTMERCFEWFIFDYRLCSGKTIIETFKEENCKSLDSYELTLAREWSKARISLYKVTGVVPGEGILIKDLLGHREIQVHDLNAATEIDVGSVLFMRVLKVGEEYEFSTSGLALPGECTERLLDRLNDDRCSYYLRKNAKLRSWGSYFRERAHVVNAFVMELGFSGACTSCTAREKEERSTILAVDDWQSVLEDLKRLESFRVIRILEDASGVFRQATAALLGKPYGFRTCDLRPVIGLLILTPRFMVLNSNTLPEMQEGKKILAELYDLVASSHDPKGEPNGIGAGESGFDFPEIPLEGPGWEREGYVWPAPGYAIVAGGVADGLVALGYTLKQQKGALKLWYDYCSQEHPAIRKSAVWTAAVIYAFTRLEMGKGLKQQELAGRYGVSPSTISARFRLLCQALQLVAYDRRYSTKKPRGGLQENCPLLKREI